MIDSNRESFSSPESSFALSGTKTSRGAMLFPSKLNSILVRLSWVNFVKCWPLIAISCLPVSDISPNSSKRFFVKARWAFPANIRTLSSHASCSTIVEKFSLFSAMAIMKQKFEKIKRRN